MAGTIMLAYYFEYTDTFSVHVQGFFCYDTSYTKPYLGPEDSSAVPPILMYAVVAGLPTLLITITETVLFLVQYTSKDFDRSEKTVATGDCCYLNPLVRRTFRFLGVYAFGLFTVDIFVNAGQVVTGNLAPYFLTVCKPNYTALGCQQALRYISHQEACTGNQDDVLRARKTFPSKEAALSVYAALYLAMYVTCTVQAKGTRLAKPVMSLGFMCLAFLTGLNRVAEYRNHWSDVIAGFIIGMAIATFLVVCVVHNFKGKLLLDEESPAEQQPNTAMLNMGQVESPLEKYIASQETDDEDEESCFIKECLQAFLRWLHGLKWFEHLRNKRQTSFEVVWKMKSLEITAHLFLFYYFLLLCFILLAGIVEYVGSSVCMVPL
ncbi:phospholipid phosphatase-related protein type 5-like isoform X2 [Girardinichthys multiradiatus]|nr:phospholipid phosphatase-related protein type 5-like isoform X2 [Girardinichthys multiradiatus]XP_047205142.1 phospholipid phosphatase-related protein type 5-like isoform X2 [Girardinichthys multiradiatus]